MKISEIIFEGQKGKLDKNIKKTMNKTHTYSDGYHADRTMNFYRVGMAAAMADGSNKPVDIDERTWFSTNNVAVPFTDLEHKMMDQAFKSVKSDVKKPVPNHNSFEADDTNRASPVRIKTTNKSGV